MNPITTLAGVLICGYATWALIMRLQAKDIAFKKLVPMREFWGPRLGSAIHYFGYVVLPFITGGILLFLGFKGVNLLEVLLGHQLPK